MNPVPDGFEALKLAVLYQVNDKNVKKFSGRIPGS